MRLHMPEITMKKTGFFQGLTRREHLQILLEWFGISLITAWLIYDAWHCFVLLLPGAVLWRKLRNASFEKKRIRRYALEFKEGMEAMAASIQAGFSAEAAVGETLKSLHMIHSKDNEMMEELKRIRIELTMNRNLEELFFEMADRSGLEDAVSLAEVFRSARRSGGNLANILEETTALLEEKEAVAREIEVILAGKRYEQRIMCLIPFCMIFYLRLGSPGYLDPLYHSAAGICVMTLCLGIYGMAVYMGSKVLAIEV